uniref:Uncharacterized protein n=1 Tax=Pithovirus LCPAC202 TaxID=2506592 RepID=A0A481Z7Q4_9VIRU|nr:MAG: hypothetical protein LCPAC202_01140 [Pithovirus LCPAC202]
MNQSTNRVTIDGIKEILKKETRTELKEQVISVLEWLNSDRPENGLITLIELDSFNQLGKLFPYELLFGTIRNKYIFNEDFIVADRLEKLTHLYPIFFTGNGAQEIYSYLMDDESPQFDCKFYIYLSSVDDNISDVLSEIEKGEDDVYMKKMLKVGAEIRLLQAYLLDTVDCGETSE